VVNATGVFADRIRRLDDPDCEAVLTPSQGAHIVLPKAFLPGDSAIMVPKTEDGRVLFAVPWHDHVVVGTTDTPVEVAELEPRPLAEEVEFLLEHAAHYLSRDPTAGDVLSVFAGLRPLVGKPGTRNTAALSRDHTILVSDSGLVTITGGKWTTYRKMAQDVIDQAELVGGLDHRACRTEQLRIHGYVDRPSPEDALGVYGSEAGSLRALVAERPDLGRPLAGDATPIGAQVVHAVRHELARTLEDVLARRTRMLLLGARASIEAAPAAARLMAQELGTDEAWCDREVRRYAALAERYVWKG
jgi:glycerol-3-phosphate dehydrogenase